MRRPSSKNTLLQVNPNPSPRRRPVKKYSVTNDRSHPSRCLDDSFSLARAKRVYLVVEFDPFRYGITRVS
jgi:hypothetical protein